jgi:hypothetical protein
MSTSFESLAVLLVLLPGFLSSLVYNALQERREVSGLRQFVEALAFAFCIDLFLASFGAWPPRAPEHGVDGLPQAAGSPLFLLSQAGLALCLPAALSALVEHGLLLRVARGLRITTRTGRASAWLDAFALSHAHVELYFKDGDRILGWPVLYSDSAEEGMIYLQDPLRVTEDGRHEELPAEGLFCCNRAELKFLTFVHKRTP